MPTTNTKPISSIAVNFVPSSKAERRVADAGSRQPSSVDFTGPIYFTLSRNTENPTAVPIITMTAMMIHAGRSRFVGKIHACQTSLRCDQIGTGKRQDNCRYLYSAHHFLIPDRHHDRHQNNVQTLKDRSCSRIRMFDRCQKCILTQKKSGKCKRDQPERIFPFCPDLKNSCMFLSESKYEKKDPRKQHSDRGKPVSTEIILRKQILAAYTGYSPAAPSEDCEHISFDIILLIFFHNVLPVPAFLSEVLLRTDLLLVSTSSSCRGWTAGSFVRSCQDQGNPALE